MDESELAELTLRFQEACKSNLGMEFLQQNPKAVFVIRLALGLSQKQFMQKINNSISQVALIKHEKGRSSRMNSNLIGELVKLLPDRLNADAVIQNYRKFESMKKGSHMTAQRARELHKIWEKRTSKKKRQEWGRKGALKTNSGQRLTEQEKCVKEILDKLGCAYKTHYQTKTRILNINIDFVVFHDSKPKYFIEVSERKHDLPILCQAYAYRCRLLKEMYPSAKTGIIIRELPFSAKQIVEKEFDFMINSNSIQNLSKFLQF